MVKEKTVIRFETAKLAYDLVRHQKKYPELRCVMSGAIDAVNAFAEQCETIVAEYNNQPKLPDPSESEEKIEKAKIEVVKAIQLLKNQVEKITSSDSGFVENKKRLTIWLGLLLIDGQNIGGIDHLGYCYVNQLENGQPYSSLRKAFSETFSQAKGLGNGSLPEDSLFFHNQSTDPWLILAKHLDGDTAEGICYGLAVQLATRLHGTHNKMFYANLKALASQHA